MHTGCRRPLQHPAPRTSPEKTAADATSVKRYQFFYLASERTRRPLKPALKSEGKISDREQVTTTKIITARTAKDHRAMSLCVSLPPPSLSLSTFCTACLLSFRKAIWHLWKFLMFARARKTDRAGGFDSVPSFRYTCRI